MAITRTPTPIKRRAPARSSIGQSFSRIITPGYEGARDAVNGSVYALANGAAIQGSAIGEALYFPGTSDNRLILGSSLIVAAHSVVTTVLLKSTGADHCLYTTAWNSAGGFHVRVTSTGAVQFIRQNQAVVLASAAGVVTFGKPTTIAVGYDGTSQYYAAVNGVEVINTTSSQTYTFTGTNVLGDQGANGGYVTTCGWMSLWAYAAAYLGKTTLLSLSKNPKKLFSAPQSSLWLVLPTGTISRPNSDIVVSGWSGVPNSNLNANIDEATPSDTDYIVSPSLNATPGPATFGLSLSLAAGTYEVRLRGRRTDASGDIRALLLDSSGATVGTSSWQTLTGSFAEYALSVTTTGPAERVQLEVRT